MATKRKFTKLDGFKFKRQAYQVPDGQEGLITDTADNAREIHHDLDYIRLVVVKRGKSKYCWNVFEYSTGVGVGSTHSTLRDAAEDSVEYVRTSISVRQKREGLTPEELIRKLTADYEVINPID